MYKHIGFPTLQKYRCCFSNSETSIAVLLLSFLSNIAVNLVVSGVLGVLLISLALCADAAIGNVQEKAMKLHNGSNSEMVLRIRLKTSLLYLYCKPNCVKCLESPQKCDLCVSF